MMPGFTFQSPRNRARAAAIAGELLKQDFDILCFEKAFDAGAREALWKLLRGRYPNQYGPANHGFSLKLNSGVWILSRIPLTELGETQFRDCAGIECFSRKGAILLRGDFHGHPFQIAATHLQGETGDQYTEAHQQIRNRQMMQMRDDLLAHHRESGAPLILAGDFDTPRQSSGFPFMLQTFDNPESQSVGVTFDDNCSDNDLAMSGKGRRDELDFIMVRPNGAKVAITWTRMVFRHPGWNGQRADLSYRYAVAAAIEFL